MNDQAQTEDLADDFSIGFLTTLVSDELIHCERVLSEQGWVEINDAFDLDIYGIKKWRKIIDGAGVTAFTMGIGRMGQTASAIETITFLTRCNCKLIFLTGIAGSLKRDAVHKGDVVISLNARWRTQNKVSGDHPNHKYRPCENPLISYSPDLSRKLQTFAAEKYPKRSRQGEVDTANWNVHCAEVYTWDYVLSSKDIVDKFNTEFSTAACVEMEAGGFLAAIERFSQTHKVRIMKGFVIKGISDYADGKDSVDAIRSLASANSARVAIDMAEFFAAKKNVRILA